MALADDPRIQSIESLLSVEEALINHAAVAQAVTAAEPVFEESWRLLEEPIDQGTHPLEIDMQGYHARRVLIWMWTIRCEKSRKDGNSAQSARILMLLWDYLSQLERPRLLVEATVDSRSELITSVETYAAKNILSRDECVRLAKTIVAHQVTRTPWHELVQRQQVYYENAFGWQIHWSILMEQWSTVPNELSWQAYWGSRGQSATVGALLSAELALRAYQLDKGIYPEKLDDLVPTYLPQTPIDPCSDTGEPLVYRRTEEGFTLYSRGYDRDEDGGRPPVAAHSWIADGDLSLKEYFKEE